MEEFQAFLSLVPIKISEFIQFNPNLGGLFRGSFLGGEGVK